MANYLLTPTEAKNRGVTWNEEPPEAEACEYCGAILERTGIALMGKIVMWQPFPTRCKCHQAQIYWAEYDKKQQQKEAQAEEMGRRRNYRKKIIKLLNDSGIKKRFRKRTFKHFICDTDEKKRCYDMAKEYADNFQTYKSNGKGLYIEGTNGTGKTHLAAAIALQLISREVPVIFRTGDDLLSDIKRTYENREIRQSEVFDIYKNVDLLIIDDLGKEQCTDWSMSALYNIINARYEDMKPIIITTNYSADNLIRAMVPKGMDDTKAVAIISRLREVSTVITMAWKDIRRI